MRVWRVIAGDVQEQDMDGEFNLTVCTGCSDEDASLISAAPKMLEALKKAKALINRLVKDSELDSPFEEEVEIDEAIAKAEGRRQ